MSEWVEESSICYLGLDSGFLKEISPGGDEMRLISDNPEETQPPPRMIMSPQVFPLTLPGPRDKASFLGILRTWDKATILCGVIITWRRRKAIDIQRGRLQKLREAERAERGRDLIILWETFIGIKRKKSVVGTHQR